MENKILFINACTRNNSRTYELAQHLLNLLGNDVTHIDLYKANISPVGSAELEKRTENIKNSNFLCEEFKLAQQFASSDIIVIAAPFWDLSFPSVLKIYFENIAICGVTFDYLDNGCPVGKCRAKKLYYITTSGGFIGENNFGFDYVKALSENFFGIRDVRFFSAEGLDIFEADIKRIMDEAKERIADLS